MQLIAVYVNYAMEMEFSIPLELFCVKVLLVSIEMACERGRQLNESETYKISETNVTFSQILYTEAQHPRRGL